MCQNSCHNSFNEFCNDDYYCSDKSKILDQIEISCDKPLVNLETVCSLQLLFFFQMFNLTIISICIGQYILIGRTLGLSFNIGLF